jgi:hypothetical protein
MKFLYHQQGYSCLHTSYGFSALFLFCVSVEDSEMKVELSLFLGPTCKSRWQAQTINHIHPFVPWLWFWQHRHFDGHPAFDLAVSLSLCDVWYNQPQVPWSNVGLSSLALHMVGGHGWLPFWEVHKVTAHQWCETFHWLCNCQWFLLKYHLLSVSEIGPWWRSQLQYRP